MSRLEDPDDPGSAAVILNNVPILLVRQGRTVFAYKNSCPHIGAPLDWTPGRFLDAGRQFILCASHGASFRIEDGFCLGGPCAGKSLDAVPVSLDRDAENLHHSSPLPGAGSACLAARSMLAGRDAPQI